MQHSIKSSAEFLLRVPYDDLSVDVKKEIPEYFTQKLKKDYLLHEDGFIWITP